MFKLRKETVTVRNILELKKKPVAIYAIGDIHGCLPLYHDLERQIVADGKAYPGPKLIVCLGDTIDRGPETAGLIERFCQPAPQSFQRVVLRGNHEDMFIKFLDAPDRNLKWVDYGGEDTLASYGIRPNTPAGFSAEVRGIHRKLDFGIPVKHRQFIRHLPIGLIVEDLHFSHAGYALNRAAKDQSAETLMWGEVSGQDKPLRTGAVAVHGHVVVDDVTISTNEINVDIGAYKTGRLAAIRFLADSDERKIFIADKRDLTPAK